MLCIMGQLNTLFWAAGSSSLSSIIFSSSSSHPSLSQHLFLCHCLLIALASILIMLSSHWKKSWWMLRSSFCCGSVVLSIVHLFPFFYPSSMYPLPLSAFSTFTFSVPQTLLMYLKCTLTCRKGGLLLFMRTIGLAIQLNLTCTAASIQVWYSPTAANFTKP